MISKLITISVLVLTLLLTVVIAQSQDDWNKELHLWESMDMDRFQNALSPDGSIKVDQVYYKKTTFSKVGLLPVAENIPVFVVDATPDQKYTRVMWNPDGNYLALHDSSKTHSKLRIFNVEQEGVKEVLLPDLTENTVNVSSLNMKEIRNSGQVPLEWISERRLKVQVRLKKLDHEVKNIITTIQINDDGMSEILTNQ